MLSDVISLVVRTLLLNLMRITLNELSFVDHFHHGYRDKLIFLWSYIHYAKEPSQIFSVRILLSLWVKEIIHGFCAGFVFSSMDELGLHVES